MNQTALLVVDVQKGQFVAKPIYQAEETLSRIAGLVARARAAQVPVVYVQDDDIGGPGNADWDVHPVVAPRADELRVRKLAADSFYQSDLEKILSRLDITHLVICGLQTQACVDATARGAAMREYEVTLACDAHSNSGSPLLAPEQIIAWHNRILDGMYGPAHGFEGSPGIRVKPSSQIEF